jgi:arsenite-transporting ATPase
VAVCIPEYLSVYETERLCQELAKADIDIRNIVVNQIVIPESDCFKCKSRYKMQWKYLMQIRDLYDDFHIILSALQNEEIKGVDGLRQYGDRMMVGLTLPGPPS